MVDLAIVAASLLLKVLLTRLLDTDVDMPYVSEIFDFVSRILEKDDRNTETIIDTIEEVKNNIVQEINSSTKKILDDGLRRQLNTLMGDSLGLITTIQNYYDAPNEHFLILIIHFSNTVSKKILLELEQINSHPAFVIESFRIYFICVCASAMAMYERKSRYVPAGQGKSISKRMSKEFEEVMKVFQKVSDKLYSITEQRFSKIEVYKSYYNDESLKAKILGFLLSYDIRPAEYMDYTIGYKFDNSIKSVRKFKAKVVDERHVGPVGYKRAGEGYTWREFGWPDEVDQKLALERADSERVFHIERVFLTDFNEFLASRENLTQLMKYFLKLFDESLL
jgi:hypothetical protein